MRFVKTDSFSYLISFFINSLCSSNNSCWASFLSLTAWDETRNIAIRPKKINEVYISENLSKLAPISSVKKVKSGVIFIYITPRYSPSGTNGTSILYVF